MLAEKDGFPPFHCYSYICCYHSIRYVCLSPTSSSTAWPLRFTPFPRTHLSCRLHICVRQTHNHVQAKKWQLRKWPKIHILLMDLRAAPFRQSTARAHANGLNVGAAFFFFFFWLPWVVAFTIDLNAGSSQQHEKSKHRHFFFQVNLFYHSAFRFYRFSDHNKS